MSSLLRSTKFVRYFAGAARTLFLNSAKTAEANLLVNSKVSTVVNNVLIRDYATTKKTESLEPLLHRLDSDVRRFGRINKKDIDDVFDEIRARQNITSSQSLLVIRCCGELVPEELPEQRTKLVQKIWSVLAEIGVPMDISHYNALLRVYIENEHQFSPAEFLEELEKKGLQPNRVTYQRIMWRYCQEGDVEGAVRVLEKMRELGFPVSEPVLNALVMGNAFLGETDSAKAVLETMAGAGLQPSNRTYALLACGYAKKGDLENIEKTLKTANEKDAIMSNKDILDIIESLALAGHGDKVESLFEHLVKGHGYNQDVCNLILRLINKGQEEVAKKIMKTMPKGERTEDSMYKGAFFIKQLIKLNKPPEDVIKTCKELMQENLVPSALYIATEEALQHGFTDLALQLFKELQKEGLEIRQHYYWPLLVKKGKENDEEGLLHILRNMASEGITPTNEALRDYVIPYLKHNDKPQNVITKLQIANVPVIHGARNLMVDLLESGKIQEAADVAVQYRPYGQLGMVKRPLLNALAKSKDCKSFVAILHVISSKAYVAEESQPNEDTQADEPTDIGNIVTAAVKNLVKPDLCEKLFSELYSKGIRISTASAESIEQYLGENLSHSISEKLVKLTSSDLALAPLQSQKRGPIKDTIQLEQIVARNKTKGTPNPFLQKQLLMAYIQENKVEKVESYLKNLQQENVELTNTQLAQLFEFYASNGMLDKAYECKEQLRSKFPDFVLNKFKIIELALALVKADRYDDAIKELQNYQAKSDEEGSYLVNSKCWQILNTLAEKKDSSKVLQMTNTLIENNIVEASNVIFGPSIKVHLLNDDVEGALKQFEECCQKYRCTPWKGEVMKTLIQKEDATRLQWLADISTQIHGEVNILHDLVLAFVECGRLRQARRILETPGLHAKHKRLQDACERYVQEGQSEHLEGLLEATKELSHIDRSNIFYHLLVTYCKADETDKAVGLWTVLQEDGEVPSQEFLAHLAEHLKSKGMKVPFVAPETITPPKEQNKVAKTPIIEESTTTKKESSEKLEKLIKAGKLDRAMDFAVKSIRDGVTPKWNVLKFLLKSLADEGKVDKIRELEPHLGVTGRKNVTYDDKLTLAIFKAGQGSEHIEWLHRAVREGQGEGEGDALARFPRSSALASIVQDEQLLAKCREVAELGVAKGNYIPINLLWMELVLAGKDSEADELWNKFLINSESIVYRRLLQETHVQNKAELGEKLLSYLKTNKNLSESVLANVYSRLINLHLAYNNTEAAQKTLDKALSEGIKKESLAKNALKRLESAK